MASRFRPSRGLQVFHPISPKATLAGQPMRTFCRLNVLLSRSVRRRTAKDGIIGRIVRPRLRLKIGDVFRLPLSEDRVGYGQIVGSYRTDAYYFAIFEQPQPRHAEPDFSVMTADHIALLALSLDALLYHGRWEIVANRPVDAARIAWPRYKEATAPDVFEAVDHTAESASRRPQQKWMTFRFDWSLHRSWSSTPSKRYMGYASGSTTTTNSATPLRPSRVPLPSD